jgi:hypothetical protein
MGDRRGGGDEKAAPRRPGIYFHIEFHVGVKAV